MMDLTFTRHATERYNERVRSVGFGHQARQEMLACLKAANPDDVVFDDMAVFVPTGCCIFVISAKDGRNDKGAVVTVLKHSMQIPSADSSEISYGVTRKGDRYLEDANHAEGLPTIEARGSVSRP